MTDFGLALLAAATGSLLFIALATYSKGFRSLFVLSVMVIGSILIALGKAKSITAKERFSWEQVWIVSFCASIGAFWAVLVGLSWVWAFTLAVFGAIFGYCLCLRSKRQWQKERKG